MRAVHILLLSILALNAYCNVRFLQDIDFAKKLQEGICFVVSVAGIKSMFCYPRFCRALSQPEDFNSRFLTFESEYRMPLMVEIDKILVARFCEENDVEPVPGEVPDGCVLRSSNPAPLTVEELKSFPNGVLHRWFSEEVNQQIMHIISDLCSIVNGELSEILDAENDPHERDAHSLGFFFDIGIEIISLSDLSLLIDSSKAFYQLRSASGYVFPDYLCLFETIRIFILSSFQSCICFRC